MPVIYKPQLSPHSKTSSMKHTLIIALLPILFGCKKSGNDLLPPSTQGSFPKNTEWVGTLDGNGFQYRRPCSLTFRQDNTFTMYANFLFFDNGAETRRDSINGTIARMDTLADGRIRITTNIMTGYNGMPTKYIDISNSSNSAKITGISADGTVATFQLERFPAAGFPIVGTHWRGISWPKSQVKEIPFACPNLSSIIFNDAINAVYSRNGQPVLYAYLTQLQHTYKQVGARVYMAGYKYLPGFPDGAVITMGYLGILLPSGDKMMVDSPSPDAQLPNYIYTNEPYGPNGQTPIIYKY
jgi:hypothetical protein